jgi:polyribonucleotide nucleotidyltransferase
LFLLTLTLMAQNPTIHEFVLDGRTVTVETGKLATQADGSVVVKVGKMYLLATVVANKDAKENVDFLPLTVDYREKFSAAGKFPGGFLKRETRLSDYEILVSRLIDRALRPLFPDDFHAETQVLVTLISSDPEIIPDAYACFAASAALAVSDIPFHNSVSEVRVARVDGTLKVNPTLSELAHSDIDMMIAATEKNIVMVEGEMKEVSEDDMLQALQLAHKAIKVMCQAQVELAKKVGKDGVYRAYSHENSDLELQARIKSFCYDACYQLAAQGNPNKKARSEGFKKIKEDFIATLGEEEKVDSFLLGKYFHDVEKDAVRNVVLDKNFRLDGRNNKQIRPIWCEIGYLPTPHGSAIFTRGETQSLTTITLGTKLDEQLIDGAFYSGTDRLVLHYNFPPFSTGEAKPMRGTGRREVGHGNLALRALKPMLPTDYPYTIRILSEILESNGSSSMATVCAGTLALMDAGVPMRKPVAGIAMGLITDHKSKFAVLSDILGDEDHLGDMDFKITGTRDGITACQMDIKVDGLPYEVLTQALEQAKEGRLHILGIMEKTIAEPHAELKPHVPRIETLIIDKDIIGAIIGPGGKVIQEIQKTTNTVITIEEKEHDATVAISGPNKEAIDAAMLRVKAIATKLEIGDIYEGIVKSVVAFGAFVELLPGKEALLHISEVDWKRLESLDGVLKTGDSVKVKIIGKDAKTGKFKLSRKVLIPQESVEA